MAVNMFIVDKAFAESYERVSKKIIDGKDFLDYFYESFLKTSPKIARLFKNTSMHSQKLLLKKSIEELLNFYHDRTVKQHLLQIGQIHGENMLNISPEMYDIWIDTLMETIKKYDPEFIPKVELAWRVTLSPGICYMKFSYRYPNLI